MNYLNFKSKYRKFPEVKIKGNNDIFYKNKDEIIAHLKTLKSNLIIFETYPGVRKDDLFKIIDQLNPTGIIHSEDYAISKDEYELKIKEDLTDDRIFGKITSKEYSDFFCLEKLKSIKEKIVNSKNELTIVWGIGASYFIPNEVEHKIVYWDLTRWESQLRYRNNEHIFFKNGLELDKLRNFKRGYFVEWRMADTIKKNLFDHIDYYVDSEVSDELKMITAKTFDSLMQSASSRPFRLVPYFDAGVWGGDWMKEVCSLEIESGIPMAWGFDGVPEENSLIFNIRNKMNFHTPAINLVFRKPVNLLGEKVYEKFGAEFPIRFDFLDTINGGNLSLQVHPTLDYIKEQFGMKYTQNESYYYLDTLPGAEMYLGIKDGVEPSKFISSLKDARNTGKFDAELYVNSFPVKKHDHILHPEGTIHSSALGAIVLEISATPYIFTFKLWDWGRVDLDGKPREINIEHAEHVMDLKPSRSYNEENYVNKFIILKDNEDYTEEKTGLHEKQFIETRRFTIRTKVVIKTHGSVNMLNLVDGKEAIVKSINGSFEPLVVHYAETFIVPNSCEKYIIEPYGDSKGETIMVLQAYVR